jgi:hypothetical protein
MAFKEVTVKKGDFYKKGYQETLEAKHGKKYRVRSRINNEVFDLHDSVADNAKMISLLFSLIMRMYGTYTDTQKGRLDAGDRALIEDLFNAFTLSTTLADLQVQELGTAAISKLLERQARIAEIALEEK